MKRILSLFFALALVLSIATAQAATYPQRHGAVNDDAAVLSDGTAQDIVTLNGRSGANFTVVTRHFLGGLDAQEYCDGLFDAWEMGDNDLLLLLVIGEERYAATLGANIRKNALSAEQLNSMLSSKLRQPFIQDRDYDGAVGAFLLAAAGQIARADGATLNTSGLFGSSQTQSASSQSSGSASSASSWFSSWTGDLWNGFFSDDELNDISASDTSYEYKKDSGFSVWKLILIVAVLSAIVRSRRKQGKSGLGFLGWLVAGIGARNVMNGIHHGGPRPPRR